MKRFPFSVVCASFLFAAPVDAQYVSLASESFNYPVGPLDGLLGGTGWTTHWWAQQNAEVTTPGFDLIGEKVTTIVSEGACYRTLDFSGWPNQAQVANGQFGLDGTTLWVRFESARIPAGDDLYGGLSLVTQLGAEHLFIGSPWMSGEWGAHDQVTNTVMTIPGSRSDVRTKLVARIDFLRGSERFRMWLDPQESYPTSGALIDTRVGDFRFNEIRLQSGSGGMPGMRTGYDFDAISLEINGGGELTTDIRSISASQGGTQTITHALTSTLHANANFLILGSISGTSPGLALSPTVILPLVPDAFTIFSAEMVNQAPIYGNSFGLTDSMGGATSTFTIPPGIAGTAIGATIYHASIIIDLNLVPIHATNYVEVMIEP